MSVLGLRFRRKKRTNFFFANRNFIAVQIFTRPISSPPAGTLRFAQSPLRGLAIMIKKLLNIVSLIIKKVPAEKNFNLIKKKSRIFIKFMPVVGLLFWPKSEQTFFSQIAILSLYRSSRNL